MKSLELIIVQFNEVERLIAIGRVPQLRLAYILLDSAVELIMHRMAKSELDGERYPFAQLENLRRIETGSDRVFRAERQRLGADWLRAEIEKLEATVVSKRRRSKIDREFAEKIDFLIGRGRLPNDLGPVLKKLHEYRNETYHRDHHRIEVIRPAVLVYVDAACTVLENYEPDTLISGDFDKPLGPELALLHEDLPTPRDLFQLPHLAAKQLREAVQLDLNAVRSALGEHLLARLADLQDNIAYVEENLTGRDVIPGDAILAMQIQDGDAEAIFDPEVMRSRNYPLTMNDLRSWVERATALESMSDKHALFTEFAAIEDCFEKVEQVARKAVWDIDEQANWR
ncbi:hypothetical protein [Cellulomonas humilata]|uniref:HEPN AbiU2-like domain-containing protein n=1 Tax=Cellulomonas humilata TaxID=144055 RepID=A0ABU0EL19_9CELL|nr:hypothetical protein [Cellulomonas humilata]MDQ0375974.1 hypothetical protein [Cellulomonas humilata]